MVSKQRIDAPAMSARWRECTPARHARLGARSRGAGGEDALPCDGVVAGRGSRTREIQTAQPVDQNDEQGQHAE